MKQSPAFSKFRNLMDIWDNYLESEEKEQKVKNLLNGQNLILFFTSGNGIFGAPEESRVIFAKMKSPDQDTAEDWVDDANFAAFDLAKALQGKETENLFGIKDLDSIKIIDRDKAEKMLMKCPDAGETPELERPHDEDGANVIKLKDMD